MYQFILNACLAILLVTVAGLFTACGPKQSDFCGTVPAGVDDGRPDILVVGDSVSMHYTAPLKADLIGYDVIHNPCNGRSTKKSINHIYDWLEIRPTWYAITFNHGMHDATAGIDTSDEVYRANLYYIAEAIKSKTTRPLFLLTTDVLPGTPSRTDARVVELNQIAIEVMSIEGIEVLDLYSFTKAHPGFHEGPHDVHYNSSGSSALAELIANKLKSM